MIFFLREQCSLGSSGCSVDCNERCLCVGDGWIAKIGGAVADVIYLANIVLNCFTTTPSEGGKISCDRAKIFGAYFGSHFVIDALSLAPLFGLSAAATLASQPVERTCQLRLLRLLPMLRILRMADKWRSESSVVGGGLLILLVVMAVHLVACSYYWLATRDDRWPVSSADGNGEWLLVGDGRFLEKSTMRDGSIATDYMHSFYLAVSMVAGIAYGDMPLTSQVEKGFTVLVILLFYKLLLALVYSSLATIIAEFEATKVRHHEQLSDTIRHLRFRRLPPEVLARVAMYYDVLFSFSGRIDEIADILFINMKFKSLHSIAENVMSINRVSGGVDEIELLNLLPKPLRSDILTHQFRDLVAKVAQIPTTETEPTL